MAEKGVEMMRENGWNTIKVGKWVMGENEIKESVDAKQGSKINLLRFLAKLTQKTLLFLV